ncbi:MAG: apolipoprotein N-acyltransferase [Pseudomonadales bacterium]
MNWLLAPVLGALFCFGLAPFDQWWWMLLSIGALFLLFMQRDTGHAWLAWAYGLGKFGFGASWVYVSIHEYGNASPALALLLVVLFTALTAFLFCWPLGWLYGRLRNAGRTPGVVWRNAILFVGLWGLLDWTATWLLTGFPWLYAGNGLLDTVFSGWLPVVGILGTSALFALSAVALSVVLLCRQHWPSIAAGLGVALLPWLVAWGLMKVEWVTPANTHTVALVQGNLDQNLKWQRDQAMPNVRRHVELSADHWDADLLIWPEAAITFYPQQAEDLLEQLARQASETQTAFVFGIPGITQIGDGYQFQNLALGVGLARGRFAKYHLVPFGEYVPFAFALRGLIDFFDLPMSSSVPGRRDQPNLHTQFGELAMAICYEVAYPQSMRRKAATASVLATISNDTWFGESIGPLQHMQLARVRARENGRWLLRATNNGVTAIVNHQGHIVAQLPQFQADTLRGEFTVMQGITPYTRHGSLWVLIGLALCLLPAIGGIFAARLQPQK